MQLLTALVLIACAGAALSCRCSPQQWNGVEGIMGGYHKGNKSYGSMGSIQVNYDAKNSRTAGKLDLYANGVRYTAQAVEDYMKRVRYIFDKDSCNVTKLRGEFREACVPENSRYKYSSHFGALQDSLDFTSYTLQIPSSSNFVSVSFTDELCIPVGISASGRFNGWDLLEVVGITGIKPGISEDAFDVPFSCKAAEKRLDRYETVKAWKQKYSKGEYENSHSMYQRLLTDPNFNFLQD